MEDAAIFVLTRNFYIFLSQTLAKFTKTAWISQQGLVKGVQIIGLERDEACLVIECATKLQKPIMIWQKRKKEKKEEGWSCCKNK